MVYVPKQKPKKTFWYFLGKALGEAIVSGSKPIPVKKSRRRYK